MLRQDYTVGWICAVQTEFVAACELLDEEHPLLSTDSPHDNNAYTLGRIGDHHMVIACLPKGRYGIASAASVAKDMLRSFESIRIGLMVGIGGGAPSDKHDIRLGDVVVGCPMHRDGGVIPYNFGKAIQDQEFERTGLLNSPPTFLLTALTKLSTDHERKGSHIAESVRMMITKNPRLRGKYQHPGAEHDRLYESSYTHRGGDDKCEICCDSKSPPLLRRLLRELNPDEPVVHYGLIASADKLMKDAVARDQLIKEHDILCFEMEAAGLMNNFPCVVIRGICDYSDSHKNDAWQGYAAVSAASYAKELLGVIPKHQIARTQTATAEIEMADQTYRVEFSLAGLPITGPFVDRVPEMTEIEQHLLSMSAPTRRKTHILHGLGGIGKTQLALAYARKHQETYSAILWLNGNSKDTLLQSLAAFGKHIPTSSRLKPLVGGNSDAPDLEAEAGAVLSWLALGGNHQWLMIIDNVDRECQTDNKDPQAYDVSSFFPNTDHGSLLVTTRLLSLTEVGTSSTEVGRLTLKQALELLCSRSGLERSSRDLDRLAKRLGCLPLALVQAGKYIRESGTSCPKYLELYETSWSELLEKVPKLRNYANGSIQTTWTISYERITEDTPSAAKFLQLWAYLDHQDVWYELFSRGMHDLPEYSWLRELIKSEISFKEIMRTLLAYSLIESHERIESYSIHPVVHDWCTELIGGGQEDTIILAFTIIGSAVPSQLEPEYWLTQQRLLPHADRCIRFLEKLNAPDERGCSESDYAFHNLGDLYAGQGKMAEAEKMYQRALEGKEKAWGPETISTLNTVNNLGMLYEDQGKLAEAEKMYQRALKGFEKAWGPKHKFTLATIHNLGSLYESQGKLTEAEEMYERALKGKEKVWGPEHIFTLSTVNNLGNLYKNQRKLTEAEKMYERALKGYEKAWGHEHTSTLDTVNNLGILYADQGTLTEAEKMFQRALKGKEKAWGPEHIFTLDTVNNLGILYVDQGTLTEAEKMFQRALKGFEKAWGPEHIFTLSTVNNLGNLYKNQRKLTEAEKIYERALKGYEKAWGHEHTSTLDIVNNLGVLYKNQGKIAEAEKMLQRALKGYEKGLSPEHTSTLNTIHNLGGLYEIQGKLAEAEEMYQRALEGREKAWGPEHTSTLKTVNNLGNLYEIQGKLAEAEKMFLRAFTGYKKLRGLDHPATKLIDRNLSKIQKIRGERVSV